MRCRGVHNARPKGQAVDLAMISCTDRLRHRLGSISHLDRSNSMYTLLLLLLLLLDVTSGTGKRMQDPACPFRAFCLANHP